MTEHDVPIGNAPKVGTEIHLVRWSRGPNGWSPETIIATYVSSTHDQWVVDRSGNQQALPREQWLIFQP